MWGGGYSGNTPGNSNGALGSSALSSTGASAWMGLPYFEVSSSSQYFVDSGHPTSIKLHNPVSQNGLQLWYSFDSSSILKAVTGDGQGSVWVVDVGHEVIRFYTYTLLNGWFWMAFSYWGFSSKTAPSSILYDGTANYVYFSDVNNIVRAPVNFFAIVSGSAVTATVVATFTRVSALSWSGDQHSFIYFLDAGAVRVAQYHHLLLTACSLLRGTSPTPLPSLSSLMECHYWWPTYSLEITPF